jgi:hypothetical protein
MSEQLNVLEALLDAKNFVVETDQEIDHVGNVLARHALSLRCKIREMYRLLPKQCENAVSAPMGEVWKSLASFEEAINVTDSNLRLKTYEVMIAIDGAIDQDAKSRKADNSHSLSDPEVRRQVLAMTDGKCTYCAATLSDAPVDGVSVKLFVEHVVPASKGGPNHLANYVPSCGSCNSAKGDRHVLHFVRKVQPIREERSTVVSIVRAGE